MVAIPGGEFSMGAAKIGHRSPSQHNFTSDARPMHRVRVDGFWMDRTDVTNEQFAQFVAATGYVTVAERKPEKFEVSGIGMETVAAGSTVFSPPPEDVDLDDFRQWWRYVSGADWRHPEGPQSKIVGKEHFPVVQIAYTDAVAYATWARKRLPTEAEWEFAARGGLRNQPYVWGALLRPSGKWMANIFQGSFPGKDTGKDGFADIAPVAKFPPNKYGLYDMAGNVWQWCSDWYSADYYAQLAKSQKVTTNPPGPTESFDPDEPNVAKRVQRGGSFLCSDQYCGRFQVGSRGKGDPSTASNHVGFRCVMTAKGSNE
jgi:formylglycine-generating enzyme